MPISKLRTTTLAVLTVALTALLLLAHAGSASAAPAVNGEFAVSEQPKQLTLGPDGNIWVTLGTKIAKVTPAGVVTEYAPADVTGPVGITSGPDGNLWVTQSGSVVKIPPAAPLTAEKFLIAEIVDPRGITTGPDGNLWTASGDKVIKIPPAAPLTYTPPYTVTGMGARGIARGGDGRLWVVDFANGQLVAVTTAGVATAYPIGGAPQEVAAGPGSQMGYANPGADPHHVGRITPGGAAQSTNVPLTDPFGITFATDGAYWFAQFASNTIGRMTTDGQVTTLAGLSPGAGPRHIAVGAGNTLWVSLQGTNKIARITGVDPPPAGTPVTPPGTDVVAPAISGLSLSRRVLRLGTAMRIGFRLSEAATVRLTFHRRLAGKRRGRARYKRAGTLVRSRPAGRSSLRFTGRIGRRTLEPGRYRLTLTATDAAGNVSVSKRVTFRLLARRGQG